MRDGGERCFLGTYGIGIEGARSASKIKWKKEFETYTKDYEEVLCQIRRKREEQSKLR
jgi:hypothetical protein